MAINAVLRILIFWLIIYPTVGNSFDCNEDGDLTSINLELCLPANYTKEQAPSQYNAKDKVVKVWPNIQEIDMISMVDNFVTYKIYLRVYWTDSRINLRNDVINKTTYRPISLDVIEHIWVPDIYFYQLQELTTYEIMKPNTGIFINGYKELNYLQEMTVKIGCRMDLSRFPHDKQVCFIKLGSFGYNDNFIMIQFPQVQENKRIKVPHPVGYTIAIQPKNKETTSWISGNYTTVSLEVTMERLILVYMFIYYAPTGLFVLMSWAAFVMPADKMQFRLGLLITIFLVVINLFNSAMSSLPSSDTPHFIEVWLILCILFILATFIQTAAMFLMLRLKVFCGKGKYGFMTKVKPVQKMVAKVEPTSDEDVEEYWVKTIDFYSFIVFVITFIVFNFAFWSIVLSK